MSQCRHAVATKCLLVVLLKQSSTMDDEARLLSSFEKAPEFFEALTPFLAVDLQREPTLEENQKEGSLGGTLMLIVRMS